MRIAICNATVPFVSGGAEVLVRTLADSLRGDGHEVEIIGLPYAWYPKHRLEQSILAFRSLDLRGADMVIAAKFPSYFVRHPRKSVWLVHQHRQAYDLAGTQYSDFQGGLRDRFWQTALRLQDRRVLGRANVHAISANVAARVKRYNGLEIPVLYPPPPLLGRYRNLGDDGYVLSVGRLDPLKRPMLLLQALQLANEEIRCKFVGTGTLQPQMEEFIIRNHLQERVELLGTVDDEKLVGLYGRASAVYFGPVDEDYGYVTVEAMASGKPVLTLADSGGPLEFVRPGVNGWVAQPSAGDIAAVLDEMAGDALARARMGRAGSEQVAGITWRKVVDALVLK